MSLYDISGQGLPKRKQLRYSHRLNHSLDTMFPDDKPRKTSDPFIASSSVFKFLDAKMLFL